SKPVEPHLPMLSAVDDEIKFDRKKSQPSQLSKTNAQYHKLFKEVSKDEPLRQSKCYLLKCIEENVFAHVCCVLVIGYTCALQRDILYQGKMFVSDNWICFHSKVFGRDTKIAIPVLSVTFLKKTKTALLVPNALVIETAHEQVTGHRDKSQQVSFHVPQSPILTLSLQHVFVSFLSRNTTFKLLKSICNHLEVNANTLFPAPHLFLWLVWGLSYSLDVFLQNILLYDQSIFIIVCIPVFVLQDFSGDLSDLDGVVQQRRQEMMESSSSGSQTPDSDKMTEFPVLQDSFLSAVKSGDVSVHADIHLQSQSQKHGATLKNSKCDNTFIANVFAVIQHETKFYLYTLVIIVVLKNCVLVLSSCYMAFKIVALEHRLNSLLSVGERIPHKPQDDMSAEIYGELSTNLFKLEK
ncbi:hypothetical protein NL108_009260, partial [Boleophthalmus pectinirostris]